MAQSDIYGRMRIGAVNLNYPITGLIPDAQYQVVFHVGEIDAGIVYFEQTIEVNGVEVVAQFRPLDVAGGIYKIAIISRLVNANSSGEINIVFKPKNGKQACIDAIEILKPPLFQKILHTAGDSRTAGGGIIGETDTWRYKLGVAMDANVAGIPGTAYSRGYDETKSWQIHNLAVNGQRIDEQESLADTYLLPYFDSNYTKEIVLLNCGINDILQGASTATITARITSYFSNITNPSAIKAIGTILPSTLLTGGQQTTLTEVNAWILANSLGINVFNPLTDSRMGNAADTDYFYDGLHQTPLGHQVFADLVKPFIEGL
jgi:lysophospholipase L1-like esterase